MAGGLVTDKQLATATSAEIRRSVKRAAKYAETGYRTAATAELHDLKRHLIRMYAVTAAEWEAGQ